MTAPRILSRFSVNAWLLLIGVPGALLYPHVFPTQQMRNLEAGQEYAPILMKLLQPDSRFSKVEAMVYTGSGGVSWVRGELSSMKDLNDLKQIIRDSHPPVAVWGQLNVAGTEQDFTIPAFDDT